MWKKDRKWERIRDEKEKGRIMKANREMRG